jgi:hypothetical protein
VYETGAASARTSTGAAGAAASTGAALFSKLTSTLEPKTSGEGPSDAQAPSDAKANATHAALSMAISPFARDHSAIGAHGHENRYAASSTKPFQVRM